MRYNYGVSTWDVERHPQWAIPVKKIVERRRLAVVISMLLIIPAIWVAARMVHRTVEIENGNYPIRFYGRVVDRNGVGIPKVSISTSIAYSPRRSQLAMYGREEVPKKYVVVTDENGDFELTGVFGFKIAITSFALGGQTLHWAFGPRDPRSPATSFVYTQKESAAQIPDSPSRRLAYFVTP